MCDSRLCTTKDEPSTFKYTGPKPNNSSIDICTPCTRRMLTTYAPSLKARIVTIECLIMTKLSLHCDNCQAFFRIERITPHTNTHVPHNYFCPHCGQKSVASFDPERDYWEIIAESLNLTVELTRMLYDAWLYDNTYPKFKDFVIAFEREAKQ